MTRLFALVGIDRAQWAALTRTYLSMDFRRGGGLHQTGGDDTGRLLVRFGAVVSGALLQSALLGMIVGLLRDPFTGAAMMTAMAGGTVAMLLLADFTGSVVAAEDYWIIAPRPVSSRTYFAARLSAVLAYVGVFALLMALAPALVFAVWHRLGFGSFVGTIAAVVLASFAGTGVIIGLYTQLIARIPAARLVPVISGAHLMLAITSLAGFLFVMRGFDDPRLRELSLTELEWLWYVPTTWFAAMIPALSGTGDARTVIAAAGAAALTLVVLVLACGNLGMEFAARLAEATTTSPRVGGRGLARIPGFARGEPYAVATLVRAQFRYDLRFRLAILGVVPMTLFYIFLGWSEGLWTDPFTGRAKGGSTVYMGIAFLPMVLHGAIPISAHWRASWIFWATPADPARLVIAAKNFVTLFVLGPYLLMMAGFWCVFYERIWHALVHAAFVGAGAHMLLQGAVMLSPQMPFSREPKHAEQSGGLFMLFFFGMLATTIGPALLPFIYARPLLTIVVAVLLAAATAVLERMLHRRVSAYAETLEFS